jgi:hypothetical protein
MLTRLGKLLLQVRVELALPSRQPGVPPSPETRRRPTTATPCQETSVREIRRPNQGEPGFGEGECSHKPTSRERRALRCTTTQDGSVAGVGDIYYTLGAGERCRDGSLCAVSTRRQRTGRANYTWWTAAPTIDRKNKLAQVQRASSQIEYRNGGREDDAGPSTDDRVNQQFVLDLG